MEDKWNDQSTIEKGFTFSDLVVMLCTIRFNVTRCYILTTQCIYEFYIYPRRNSDYFPIQHQLSDFCNRCRVCLLGEENIELALEETLKAQKRRKDIALPFL
jgi:hypothetical protein